MKKPIYSLLGFLFPFFAFSQAANDSCHQAIVLEDSAIFTLADAQFSNSVCEEFTNYDIWYSFIGVDSIMTFTLQGNGPKLSVFVLSGPCDNLVCEPITNAGNIWALKTEKDKSYFLNIASNGNGLQDTYQIIIDKHAPLPNDEFENALELNCQDTLSNSFSFALTDAEVDFFGRPSLWYKIIGTGVFIDLQYQLSPTSFISFGEDYYTFTDGLLSPYFVSRSSPFYLEKDSVLYLNLTPNFYVDTFQIWLDCTPPIANDECSSALSITLSDTISGTTAFASGISNALCEEDISKEGVWYEFVGNGKLMNFLFTEEFSRFNYAIGKGDCDTLNCIEPTFFVPFTLDEVTSYLFEDGVTYYLKVYNSSRGFEENTFEFYFEEIPLAENDLCKNAISISCGTTISNSLLPVTDNHTTCTEGESSIFGMWFSIEGTGDYIAVDYTDSLANLSLLGKYELFNGSCDTLSCETDKVQIYGNRLIFKTELATTYYLLLGNDNFQATIQCFEVENHDTPETAFEVDCGQQYTGYAFETTYENLNLCIGEQTIRDMWFKIEGNDQFLYKPETFGSGRGEFNGVYLQEDSNFVCLDFFRERLFLNTGTTYFLRYIIYDLDNNFVNASKFDYDFRFECAPRIPYDQCSTALEMVCGDSIVLNNRHAEFDEHGTPCNELSPSGRAIWLKITGDNSWKRLEITSLDNSFLPEVSTFVGDKCDSLTCFHLGNIFFAEKGITYFISSSGKVGATQIKVFCETPAINDFCEDAIPIVCGDTIKGNLDYSTICEREESCVNDPSGKNIWYEFIGTGELINFEFKSFASNSHTADVRIYENYCCNKSLIPNTYGSDEFQSFLSEVGKRYLIEVVLTTTWDNGRFELIVNCLDPNEFYLCENTIPINFGETISLDMSRTIGPDFDQFAWLSFIGSGGPDTIILESRYDSRINLMLESPDNCLFGFSIEQQLNWLNPNEEPTIYTINTQKNVKYILAVEGRRFVQNQQIDVTLKQATTPNFCQLLFPDTLTMKVGDSIWLPFDLIGIDSTFDFSINLNESNITSNDILFSGDSILFIPQSPGRKIIQYFGFPTTCRGHNIFYVNLTDWIEAEEEENDCFTSSISDTELTVTDWSVFPNPTIDNLIIKWDNPSPFTIRLIDLNGRILIQQENQRQLSIADFPKGIYFLTLLEQLTGRQHTKKVIKL